MLPQVDHLVDESGEHVLNRASAEVLRVQSDFIGGFAIVVLPAVAREVSIGRPLTLQRDEARRKLVLEQAAIEVVVGLLKLGVGGAGRFGHVSRVDSHGNNNFQVWIVQSKTAC